MRYYGSESAQHARVFRASVAVEKALGEPIRDVVAARDSWAEVAAVPRTAMGIPSVLVLEDLKPY